VEHNFIFLLNLYTKKKGMMKHVDEGVARPRMFNKFANNSITSDGFHVDQTKGLLLYKYMFARKPEQAVYLVNQVTEFVVTAATTAEKACARNLFMNLLNRLHDFLNTYVHFEDIAVYKWVHVKLIELREKTMAFKTNSTLSSEEVHCLPMVCHLLCCPTTLLSNYAMEMSAAFVATGEDDQEMFSAAHHKTNMSSLARAIYEKNMSVVFQKAMGIFHNVGKYKLKDKQHMPHHRDDPVMDVWDCLLTSPMAKQYGLLHELLSRRMDDFVMLKASINARTCLIAALSMTVHADHIFGKESKLLDVPAMIPWKKVDLIPVYQKGPTKKEKDTFFNDIRITNEYRFGCPDEKEEEEEEGDDYDEEVDDDEEEEEEEEVPPPVSKKQKK
jgi:hypothetical protein